MKLNSKYRHPSRQYSTNCVISPMYYETKDIIIDKLKEEKLVLLTADAWISFAKKSLVTLALLG